MAMQQRMAKHVLVEICVESLALAAAAERGGADRIELCSDLSVGGVTASAELMRSVRQSVSIPIHVLIRPRAGDFCYSAQEFENMRREIGRAREIGMDGIVAGILMRSGEVDRERTRALVDSAHPLPVVFHRAFDQVPNMRSALEAVIETGAKRILTSGGAHDAVDNLDSLKKLVADAGDRIVIMPGGGIRASHAARIVESTRASEIHTSLGGLESDSTAQGAALFEERVRSFRKALQV
jgi:copper homeostasis protein